MHVFRWTVGLAAFGLLAMTTNAEAVPSFTRQTGLTCNQCHVSYGGPVPNFTFTGKLFRINGYRMPYITEKIEAGRPGEVSGRRLAMPLAPYLSLRYQSTVFSQRKSPGAIEAGSLQTNPTSRLAIFPAGAVSDNIGLWVELYLTPSAGGEWGLGSFSFDEYDLRFVKTMENATLGAGINNQSIRAIAGFGPWPVGLTNYMTRGGSRGWSHPNRANLFAYGWFNNSVLAVLMASPGENNLDWGDGRYYSSMLAWAPFNSDAREVWLGIMTQFGDDGIPIVSSSFPQPNEGTWGYRDAIGGISATRFGGPQAYLSSDIGDYIRTQAEVRYGFIDRGMHSLETAVRFVTAREEYVDRAQFEHDALGGALRYVYNRTWGLDLVVDKSLNYSFIDQAGTTHDLESALSYRTYLTYRPAMNFMFVFNAANAQSVALGQTTVPTGWSWSLSVDFLF